MKTFTFLAVLGFLAPAATVLGYSDQIQNVIKAAEADSIDLFALSFVEAAFASIDEIYDSQNTTIIPNFASANKIDVHGRHKTPFLGKHLLILIFSSCCPRLVSSHCTFDRRFSDPDLGCSVCVTIHVKLQ